MGSSFCAYSWTALARGESGRETEETETGFAGLEDAWDCERRVLRFMGTACQPYFSIAGLLILRSL